VEWVDVLVGVSYDVLVEVKYVQKMEWMFVGFVG
jgi:hypothetical protein